MQRVQNAIPLLFVYLALSGNVTLPNLVLGVVIALGVSALLPGGEGKPYPWRSMPGFLVALVQYLFVVISDVIKGGFTTARIVLDPKLPINPGIVVIDSGSRSELATALSAHAMTLSPGELVVEMDEQGLMYTHCLDVSKSGAYAAEAQALRRRLLSRMFA